MIDYDLVVVSDNRKKTRWDKDIEELFKRGLNGYQIWKELRKHRADISKQTIYNRVAVLKQKAALKNEGVSE